MAAYDSNNHYPSPSSRGGAGGSGFSGGSSDELLTKLLGFSETSLNHPMWSTFLVNAKKDFAYKEGDTWTSEELSELELRGQVPTNDNIIYILCDQLIGKQRSQKTRISFKGRNAAYNAGQNAQGQVTDEQTATILSDLAKYVQQTCGYEHEEAGMFDDGATSGFGCLWSDISFDDEGNPQINWRHQDCLNVFYDPYSRNYDWNKDASYVGRWNCSP